MVLDGRGTQTCADMTAFEKEGSKLHFSDFGEARKRSTGLSTMDEQKGKAGILVSKCHFQELKLSWDYPRNLALK